MLPADCLPFLMCVKQENPAGFVPVKKIMAKWPTIELIIETCVNHPFDTAKVRACKGENA
jgi:hypothetical protein